MEFPRFYASLCKASIQILNLGGQIRHNLDTFTDFFFLREMYSWCLKEGNAQLCTPMRSTGLCQKQSPDAAIATVLSVLNRANLWLILRSINFKFDGITKLTVNQAGRVVWAWGGKAGQKLCVIETVIYAEGEQMQLPVSLICIWSVDSFFSCIEWITSC